MKSRNEYQYPLDKKWLEKSRKRKIYWVLEQLIAGTHKGNLRFSIDYMVPISTPIFAVADGEVVWLRDDSKEGGPRKKYWTKGNRIVLKHENDEYTGYEHLKFGGVSVKLGQVVKRGDVIGYSGKTGYGFLPHLHFEVFVQPESDLSEGVTIKPTFTD